MRSGYQVMASDAQSIVEATDGGWTWPADGKKCTMLDERGTHRLAMTAIGKDAAGIVETVQPGEDGVTVEVYSMSEEGVLSVVGLEARTKEAAADLGHLMQSLVEMEPVLATERQRTVFWDIVTRPLAN